MEAGRPYLRELETAAAAYSHRDFTQALDHLDLADKIHPDVPDTWNMRGAIYAEQHAYEKAGDAFEKAQKLNPGDFWPPYNLAQLLLMEKKYAQAADAFQRLAVYQGHDELLQFKIVFSYLLAGKPDQAKPVLDAMKFPCDTPAYYFAHASWEYAHKDQSQGDYYVKAALKIFGSQPSMSFYDSLAGMGWVKARAADGSVPEDTHLLSPPDQDTSPAN